jgi:hypothetical protein
MKNIIAILFIGFLTFSINAQEKKEVDPNAPAFEFETEVIDFGKIEHKSDGVRVFKFKNAGKSPLVISNARSSCGCTVPKFSKDPIMPGESGTIEVKYDTNRIGGFSKSITIYSNANEKMKRIRIKGIVMRPETNTATKTNTAT